MKFLKIAFILILLGLLVWDIFILADYAKLPNKTAKGGAIMFLLFDLAVVIYYFHDILTTHLPKKPSRGMDNR